MNDATRIVAELEKGIARAAEQLLPLVYEELRKLATRKLAHEKAGQTLEPTALVHEAYMRLVDVEKAQHWDSRGHFFAAAAQAMRPYLADGAGRKRTDRRGGKFVRQVLDEDRAATSDIDDAGTEANCGQGAAFSAVEGMATDETLPIALHMGLENFIGTQTANMETILSAFSSTTPITRITITESIPEPSSLLLLSGIAFPLWGPVRRHTRRAQPSASWRRALS